MALNDQLKRYLEQERAAYETSPHREVFTACKVVVCGELGSSRPTVAQRGGGSSLRLLHRLRGGGIHDRT